MEIHIVWFRAHTQSGLFARSEMRFSIAPEPVIIETITRRIERIRHREVS